jgi:hypothetical protein
MKGHRLGYNWASDDKQLAFTFKDRAYTKDCEGKLITLTDQGTPYLFTDRTFDPLDPDETMYPLAPKESSRDRRGIVSDSQLAYRLQALENNLRSTYRNLFRQAMANACSQLNSIFEIIKVAIVANPTLAVRTILNATYVFAHATHGILHTWVCQPVTIYQFLPMKEICTQRIPVTYEIQNHTRKGFMDMKTNIIHTQSLPTDCSFMARVPLFLNHTPLLYNRQSGRLAVVGKSQLITFFDPHNYTVDLPGITIYRALPMYNWTILEDRFTMNEVFHSTFDHQNMYNDLGIKTTHLSSKDYRAFYTGVVNKGLTGWIRFGFSWYQFWVGFCCVAVSIQIAFMLMKFFYYLQNPMHMLKMHHYINPPQPPPEHIHALPPNGMPYQDERSGRSGLMFMQMLRYMFSRAQNPPPRDPSLHQSPMQIHEVPPSTGSLRSSDPNIHPEPPSIGSLPRSVPQVRLRVANPFPRSPDTDHYASLDLPHVYPRVPERTRTPNRSSSLIISQQSPEAEDNSGGEYVVLNPLLPGPQVVNMVQYAHTVSLDTNFKSKEPPDGIAPQFWRKATGSSTLTTFVMLTIEHVPVQALIDTGATISVMSKDLVQKLGGVIQPLPDESSHIQGIEGQPFQLEGMTYLKLKVGEDKMMAIFRVILPPPTQTCLIGTDILRHYSPRINYADQLITLGNYEFPLLVDGISKISPNALTARVFSEVRISVPARHEIIFPAQVDDPQFVGSDLVLMDPHNNLESKRLRLCHLIVQVDKNLQFPCRIMNTTDKAVSLHARSTITMATATEHKDHVYHLGFEKRVYHSIFKVNPVPKPVLAIKYEMPDPAPDEIPSSLKVNPSSKAPTTVPPDRIVIADEDIKMDRDSLPVEYQDQLTSLVRRYSHVFSQSPWDIGLYPHYEHPIDTADHPPIAVHPYRVSAAERPLVYKALCDMNEAGVIEGAASPWNSPILLVAKKDTEEKRFCCDYRKLNIVTRKDLYPLPNIQDILDSLAKAKWYTSLDLVSAFWQVAIKEEDRDKTAFVTPYGQFRMKRLAFGLCNSPAAFQRVADMVLSGLQGLSTMIYLDDCIIYSPDIAEHLEHLEDVLRRFALANLKLKLKKCLFAQTSMIFLGFKVTGEGITADPRKVEAMVNYPTPKSKLNIQETMGLFQYYKRFVPDFARIAIPLYQLTQKDVPFEWNSERDCAFKMLKAYLSTPPILAYPDFELPFILLTDACHYGLGAILSQKDEHGRERVISYASRVIHKHEKNWPIIEKEGLAVVWGLEIFRPYLLGHKVTIRTDHQPLKYIFTTTKSSGRLQRWAMEIFEYDYEIEYKPGKENKNADALSRNPVQNSHPDAKPSTVLFVNSNHRRPKKDDNYFGSFDLTPRLRKKQEEDPQLAVIIAKLKDEEIVGYYFIDEINGILFHKASPHSALHNEYLFQIVVPLTLRSDVMEAFHNDSLGGGHLSYDRTLEKVRTRFYWENMNDDVASWIGTCVVCQHRKPPPFKTKTPLQPLPTVQVMYSMVADHVGPFKRSIKGNQHILVFMDRGSKFAFAYPTVSTSAKETADIFVDQIICRYGAPVELQTDNAPGFRANLLREVCENFKVKKIFSSAYHPESQGQVERFNRTLLSMLAAFVSASYNDWDEFIAPITFAYNISVHETTRYSPYFLMFGRDPITPFDVPFRQFRPPLPALELYDENFPAYQAQQLHLARYIAQQNIEQNRMRMQHKHDMKLQIPDLQVGTTVWMRIPKKNKLAPMYSGPFSVKALRLPIVQLIYPLNVRGTKKEKPPFWIHISRIKATEVHRLVPDSVPLENEDEIPPPGEDEDLTTPFPIDPIELPALGDPHVEISAPEEDFPLIGGNNPESRYHITQERAAQAVTALPSSQPALLESSTVRRPPARPKRRLPSSRRRLATPTLVAMVRQRTPRPRSTPKRAHVVCRDDPAQDAASECSDFEEPAAEAAADREAVGAASPKREGMLPLPSVTVTPARA